MLKLDSANVVIVGKFNPYIFSPEWLMNQNIWSCAEIQLALGAVPDGVHFHSSDGSVAWEIGQDGLKIAGKEAGELAEKVIRTLPHTPLAAVGCNFSYSAEHWSKTFVPMLGKMALDDLPTKFNPELTSWTGVFHVDDVRIQMMLATGREGITVTFNYHQSITSSEAAISALQKFEQHLQHTAEMIREILGETNVDIS